ncbi:phospho-N-acetylmuramoyl-pentapeptide-transferase [Bacillus paramycoides]|uniref:phospho-N-acetylmuramoyl-pentapeptide- transferase n=1 Tax=Bacillus paramycoides TaxID=2026194 RepID=UPI00027A0801|nr:phospho-N-acetylmuramoyl-pentapeptide-transferase [Bacillus paramycoides]EJR53479.1 phospho-N-acetylmuramoyl-pentapeptide-transferase [Bacillus cereus VD107]MED0966173.1 phospho-N-acetylmuramoyl-pentapeptide-transferase [Bacillus paramycoides]MED1112843.1 phospho-N-acetylmuramoyl-pentapeptide-transferase [Bacillus paramycoides]
MLEQGLLVTAGVAFLISVALSPLFIPFLRKLKFGQSIRDEGPKSHQKKSGTPTMGGIVIYVSMMVTTLIMAFKFNYLGAEVSLLLLVTFGYGLIGFLDDYIKVVKKRNLGLTSKQKLIGQLVIAIAFFFIGKGQALHTYIMIPGTDVKFELSWAYFVLVLFMLIGGSNAVNLTDGLDGLLSGTAAIAFGAFSIIAVAQEQFGVAIFCMAVVGAVLGFLVFNANPAKVFMGDTGSLALGGAIAAVAILLKQELLLVIIGGVFVAETLSVIIQVISFKTTGKRVFKMSPLHHHYELCGWSEWRVVVTFWSVGFLLAVLGIYIGVWM